MKFIVISGSRNPQGQTARAIDALVHGLKSQGAQGEIYWLPALKVERCRQCDDNGWGICRTEGRCVIEDDLAMLVGQLKAADLAIFATPVYFGDLSESLRAFTDRLRRTCMQESGASGIKDKPAVGLCVAGGGGGGGPTCIIRAMPTIDSDGCRPPIPGHADHLFRHMASSFSWRPESVVALVRSPWTACSGIRRCMPDLASCSTPASGAG